MIVLVLASDMGSVAELKSSECTFVQKKCCLVALFSPLFSKNQVAILDSNSMPLSPVMVLAWMSLAACGLGSKETPRSYSMHTRFDATGSGNWEKTGMA